MNQIGGICLAWSYNRLWIMLINKGMKRTDLLKVAGLNSSAVAHMGKNQPVTMNVLEKICCALNCRIEDIVEYVPDIKKSSEKI